jgi:FlaG/FlaF family flagellin (archaellin)
VTEIGGRDGGDRQMRTFRRNKKGISTVIATIIIVAIAIVMAIAVAYWVLGIGGSFTRFEKLQFTSAYATSDTLISVTLKNTGTAPATLDRNTVFINGQPVDKNSVNFNSTTADTFTMQPGDIVYGNVTLSGMSPGTTVEVKIQTASGDQYPQVVVLP